MAKKIPQRMCVICRQMKPKPELVRIVATPEGITPDTTGRMHGRGAYLCIDGPCIEQAVKTRRLQGQLKAQMPEDLGAKLMDAAAERRAAITGGGAPARTPTVRRVSAEGLKGPKISEVRDD